MFDRIRTARPVDRPWPALAQRRGVFNLFMAVLAVAVVAAVVFGAVAR